MKNKEVVNKMMLLRRTKEKISADILSIALEPANATTILRSANLGYVQYLSYTELLLERELIERLDRTTWLTTDKGRRYLAAYSSLTAIDQLGIVR
jgi:predicted transcriptional regulator